MVPRPFAWVDEWGRGILYGVDGWGRRILITCLIEGTERGEGADVGGDVDAVGRANAAMAGEEVEAAFLARPQGGGGAMHERAPAVTGDRCRAQGPIAAVA